MSVGFVEFSVCVFRLTLCYNGLFRLSAAAQKHSSMSKCLK